MNPRFYLSQYTNFEHPTNYNDVKQTYIHLYSQSNMHNSSNQSYQALSYNQPKTKVPICHGTQKKQMHYKILYTEIIYRDESNKTPPDHFSVLKNHN